MIHLQAVATHASTGSRSVDLAATFSRWYAANASIRRLLAIEDSSFVTVFLALEPSSDGDDALPAWLANSRAWVRDLEALLAREVKLELLDPADSAALDAPSDACIANLHWRDFWDIP